MIFGRAGSLSERSEESGVTQRDAVSKADVSEYLDVTGFAAGGADPSEYLGVTGF